MATTVVSTVGATGDYTTWALWEAAAPANLVTADQIWQGQGLNEEFYVTGGPAVTIAGQTTDSTRYMEMTTASGASFADNANKLTNKLGYYASQGCALRVQDYYNCVEINTNYTRVSKLQIKAALGGRGVKSTVDYTDIDQCIIAGDEHQVEIGGSGGTKNIRNTLMARTGAGGNYGIYATFGTVNILNCTIVRSSNQTPDDTAIYNDYCTLVVQNTSCFGFTAFTARTGSRTANNNASDLATDIGTSSQGSLTYADQFEQPSNASSVVDFRTKAGSAQLVNGADLSGSGITVDIVGNTRSTPYNIGVWQPATSANYAVDASAQAYTYTAASVDVVRGRVLDVTGQAYTYQSGAVDIARGRSVDATGQAYTYGAGSVDIAFGRVADVTGQSYQYAAGAVDIARGWSVDATAQAYTYGAEPVDISVTGSVTVDVSALAYTYTAAAVTISYQPAATGDTHDGFLKRTRRQRAMDAAERRRRDEEATERNALRLSLEAALGMAAEVVEDAPAEAVAAVETAVDAARAVAPAVARAAPGVDLSAATRALDRLHAAIEAAARAKAMADDDEDVEILLRAL